MYPGLAASLKAQLKASEWELIQEQIRQVDNLPWHQVPEACRLLEEAASIALNHKCYRCAARILRYYDLFYLPE